MGFKVAMEELVDGIKHFNFTIIEDAVEKFAAIPKKAEHAVEECKDVPKIIVTNVKAIISAIRKFKGPKDAVIHIVDNLFADGETIFEELGEAGKDYKETKYMGSGHNLGMAFRRILVGNAVPLVGLETSEMPNLVV